MLEMRHITMLLERSKELLHAGQDAEEQRKHAVGSQVRMRPRAGSQLRPGGLRRGGPQPQHQSNVVFKTLSPFLVLD